MNSGLHKRRISRPAIYLSTTTEFKLIKFFFCGEWVGDKANLSSDIIQ
jgi:hypothetical protein